MRRARLITPNVPMARRAAVTGLVGLDAVVVLLGTTFAWILLGIAEIDQDVPGWISPAAVALGVATAGLTAGLAISRLRGRTGRLLASSAALLHLGLAAATAIAFHSIAGTAVLLAGAMIVAAAGRRTGT